MMTEEEIINRSFKVFPPQECFEPEDPDDKIRDAYVRGMLEMQETVKVVPNMISPFTGGEVTLEEKETEVEFRGEPIVAIQKFYRCKDTGREFTDATLEGDFMWTVFRKYCEKKGYESFQDILPDPKKEEWSWKKVLTAKGSIFCYGMLLGWALAGLLVWSLI